MDGRWEGIWEGDSQRLRNDERNGVRRFAESYCSTGDSNLRVEEETRFFFELRRSRSS